VGGRDAVAGDPARRLIGGEPTCLHRTLTEKIGQLTMERDFLEGALGKFPGLSGKR